IGDLMVNNGVGNNTISSLKMPNDGGPYGWGYTVTLYADAGYRGASKSFMSDAEYVGDELDNQTSSIRIMAMME
ncbi:MAG: hypothetical protein ACRDJK_01675, partial [Actinomycetota bacterium]